MSGDAHVNRHPGATSEGGSLARAEKCRPRNILDFAQPLQRDTLRSALRMGFISPEITANSFLIAPGQIALAQTFGLRSKPIQRVNIKTLAKWPAMPAMSIKAPVEAILIIVALGALDK
jgi:hypothetical protein